MIRDQPQFKTVLLNPPKAAMSVILELVSWTVA